MQHHIKVSPEQADHLVGSVGGFALGMLATFVKYRNEMSSEAFLAFDTRVRDFTAKVSEFFPVEDLIDEVMADEGGEFDEA